MYITLLVNIYKGEIIKCCLPVGKKLKNGEGGGLGGLREILQVKAILSYYYETPEGTWRLSKKNKE